MPNLTDRFRNAFRTYPTGVAILSATLDGQPMGMTVSSLASLTLDPLAVSFSISNAAGAGGNFLQASGLVFNLLSEDQADLAEIFARPDAVDQRFEAGQGWDYLPTGEPYHPAAMWSLRARQLGNIETGSARLVAAEVLNILPGSGQGPLLYHNRTFLGLADTKEAVASEG